MKNTTPKKVVHPKKPAIYFFFSEAAAAERGACVASVVSHETGGTRQDLPYTLASNVPNPSPLKEQPDARMTWSCLASEATHTLRRIPAEEFQKKENLKPVVAAKPLGMKL